MHVLVNLLGVIMDHLLAIVMESLVLVRVVCLPLHVLVDAAKEHLVLLVL
jgi:hypothetical protein